VQTCHSVMDVASPGWPRDAVAWCLSEAKKGTNAIGFVPRERFEYDARRGRVCVVVTNGDLVAFLLRGSLRSTVCVITQLWTRQDARQLHHAAAAVGWCRASAVHLGCEALQATCADDLEAQKVWPRLGFQAVATLRPNNVRKRLLTVWREDLPEPRLFQPGWVSGRSLQV
jgi:hypothetical protein